MAATHEDFSRTHKVEASSNRAFGWVFTVVFLLVALRPVISGNSPRWWLLVVSSLMALVTVAAPYLLTVPNRLWLRFGLLLNRIISPIALGILYYAVVTPTGLLMRVFSKDSLRLSRSTAVDSYWIRREPPGPKPDSLSNQF